MDIAGHSKESEPEAEGEEEKGEEDESLEVPHAPPPAAEKPKSSRQRKSRKKTTPDDDTGEKLAEYLWKPDTGSRVYLICFISFLPS